MASIIKQRNYNIDDFFTEEEIEKNFSNQLKVISNLSEVSNNLLIQKNFESNYIYKKEFDEYEFNQIRFLLMTFNFYAVIKNIFFGENKLVKSDDFVILANYSNSTIYLLNKFERIFETENEVVTVEKIVKVDTSDSYTPIIIELFQNSLIKLKRTIEAASTIKNYFKTSKELEFIKLFFTSSNILVDDVEAQIFTFCLGKFVTLLKDESYFLSELDIKEFILIFTNNKLKTFQEEVNSLATVDLSFSIPLNTPIDKVDDLEYINKVTSEIEKNIKIFIFNKLQDKMLGSITIENSIDVRFGEIKKHQRSERFLIDDKIKSIFKENEIEL